VVAVPVKLPVITPLFIVTPEIAVAEATYKLPPIPTPPPTTKVPEVVDVEEILDVNPTDPKTCNLYPGFVRPIPKFPAYSLAVTLAFAFALIKGIPVMLKDLV
jgi:hypothetical protein